MSKLLFYINIFVFSLLPLFLSAYLFFKQHSNLIKWLVDCFCISSFIIYVIIIASWGLSISYFIRYIILLVFIVSLTKSIISHIEPFIEKSLSLFQILALFFPLSMFIIFSIQLIYAFKGYVKPDKSLNLEFPLKKGMFCIAQGGGSRLINHHYLVETQKHGLDIVLINKTGSRAKKIFPKNLNEFNIYSMPVYSPCNGVIIKVVDLYFEEQEEKIGVHNTKNPGGNYVAICCGENKVIILAHLQKNSISVKEGSTVHIGDLIGKVGNSGNSTEPHLHIHGLSLPSENFFLNGDPVPLTFNKKFLHRNQIVWNK